jgi:8-oxo-dGTP diphosphatase
MPHNVAVGILVASKRMLLCHRRPGRRWYADRWDLPGGHIGDGETPRAALARELGEELGVQVEQLSEEPSLEIRERAEEVDGLVLTAWLVDAWAGEPANIGSDEHDDMRWFEASQLPALSLAHMEYGEALTKVLIG